MTERRQVPAGRQDALRRLYDGLAGVVVGIASAPDLLEGCRSLATFGVQHLGADVAGVSRLPRRGGLEMLAATGPLGALVEPGREVGEPVASASPPAEGEARVLRADSGSDPSLALSTEAVQLGLRAALLIGLPAFSSGPVTLELYSRTPTAFDAVPTGIAAHVTALAGTALRDLERRTNLEEALNTRGVIGQAQGILMEHFALTGDQAMSYLRRHSQESHQPVRALASEIIGRHETASQAPALEDDLH